VKWEALEIVATDEPGAFGCVKITITIDRKQRSLLWLEEPANQNLAICKETDANIHKYTIEDSPGWKGTFGKK
jgi:hypothetical protein